jgi:LmbE family N-acetylglucosaminyl deacetylase
MLSFIRRPRPLGHDLPLCKLPGPLDLQSVQRVMVFAPHPDDESLGCGGTIALLARHCEVVVVLVTDGSGAGGLPEGAAAIRQQEFRRALSVLGVHHSHCLQAPDGAFVDTVAMRKSIDALLLAHRPQWVFLPSILDYHRDHLRISDLLHRLSAAHRCVERLLFYEIWAPVPATHVVDITDVWLQKLNAIAEHHTAMACGDYLRAIEGLNAYRGLYLGRAGRWAEAFWVEDLHHGPSVFDTVQRLALQLLRRMAGAN